MNSSHYIDTKELLYII